MTTTTIEITRPQPAVEAPTARRGVSADDWRELMRALAGTDEDDLPVFGRMPA